MGSERVTFKRFNMEVVSRCGTTFDELIEHPNGVWMLFGDHFAAMALARDEIELLKGEVKAAETRSGMATVVAQYEAQLKAERAEIAALRAALKRCHDLIQDGMARISLEDHSEWFVRAGRELLPCDETDECPTLAAAMEGVEEKP